MLIAWRVKQRAVACCSVCCVARVKQRLAVYFSVSLCGAQCAQGTVLPVCCRRLWALLRAAQAVVATVSGRPAKSP